jgi:hypothetical protein
MFHSFLDAMDRGDYIHASAGRRPDDDVQTSPQRTESSGRMLHGENGAGSQARTGDRAEALISAGGLLILAAQVIDGFEPCND